MKGQHNEMGHQRLEITMVPTDELTAYAGNAKIHTEEQVEQIAQSIEEFDFADPIAAWHDGNGNSVIIEGHGRLMAAQKLGIEELPVIYLDYMSDEERRAYTLVHNQLTMNTGFDLEALDRELSKITDFDMGFYGFDSSTAEEMVNDIIENDVPTTIEDLELQPITKTFFLLSATEGIDSALEDEIRLLASRYNAQVQVSRKVEDA